MCLVSSCNDYNCLYITGESDHRMGLEAVGNSGDVWRFHFATSFSFSLVEQLVGNKVWNTTQIGSVTLGLFESYLNNETLELFYSNGYLFLKRENDNSTLLFLDMDTGIVRDIFSDYGLLGTMPCYHDNITDNAWAYGNNLLDNSSLANKQINVVFGACFLSSFFVEAGMSLGSFFVEAGMFLTGIVPVLGEFTLGGAGLVGVALIPIFIVLFPDESNALWLEFAYLLNPEARYYPDIPIYEGMDLNASNIFRNYPSVIINPDEKLYDYYNTVFAKGKQGNDKTYRALSRTGSFSIDISSFNIGGGPEVPDPGNITERFNKVVEYIKEFKDEFMAAEGIDKFFVLKDNLLKITTIGIFMFSEETIFGIILYCIIEYFYISDHNNSTNNRSKPHV